MVKLRILRKKNDVFYVLLDEKTGKIYTLIFEFYGINAPKKNDYISFDMRLLKPNFAGFAQPYALKKADEDEILSTKEIDIFILETEDGKIALKRIYG